MSEGSRTALPLSETQSPSERSLEGDDRRLAQQATVLVVDDERAVRAIIAVALEALGHRVLAAASGREACELYAQHRGCIDLVMLDLTMPEMNGEQTLQALREQDAEVRALLMTGYFRRRRARSVPAPRIYWPTLQAIFSARA